MTAFDTIKVVNINTDEANNKLLKALENYDIETKRLIAYLFLSLAHVNIDDIIQGTI